MKKELTKNERITIACFIFFSTLIFCGFIMGSAARGIIEAGEDMSYIRSVGGNSINESYFQAHGYIYICIGKILMSLSILSCLVAGFVSGWIIKPIVDLQKSQKMVGEIKEKVVSIQPINKPEAPVNEVKQEQEMIQASVQENMVTQEVVQVTSDTKYCTECGAQNDKDALFCRSCGTKLG